MTLDVAAEPERVDGIAAQPGRVDGAPVTTVYAPARPVNIRQTLSPFARGPVEPTMRLSSTGFWKTMRTPLGPATLNVESASSELHAAAWGPGAEWAISALPELLGASDDWSELDLSTQPMLAEIRRRNPGLWLTCSSLVFDALVAVIFEQKVTTVEALRSWRSLVKAHGEPAPGPAPEGMRVIPSPRQWQLIPSWEWHRAGVGPDRAKAVMAAAAVASGLNRLAGPGLTRNADADVLRALQSVRGIGAWTAAETTQRSHGHPDAVSVGDYHLAAHVGWVLVGKAIDDDAMLELLEPWAGHRQRIVRLVLQSGIAKPRFAPRASIQDHRWH